MLNDNEKCELQATASVKGNNISRLDSRALMILHWVFYRRMYTHIRCAVKKLHLHVTFDQLWLCRFSSCFRNHSIFEGLDLTNENMKLKSGPLLLTTVEVNIPGLRVQPPSWMQPAALSYQWPGGSFDAEMESLSAMVLCSVILIFKAIPRNWASLVSASGQAEWPTPPGPVINMHINSPAALVWKSPTTKWTSMRQKTAKLTSDVMLLINGYHIPYRNAKTTALSFLYFCLLPWLKQLHDSPILIIYPLIQSHSVKEERKTASKTLGFCFLYLKVE